MMKKILVIDDDLDLCKLLEKFLSKKGYQVQTALQAKYALPLLKKEAFDLVLCDYRLPDASGREMLQKIKSLRPQTLFIMITGYSDVRTAVSILREGAFDYVTKPLYPDEILHTIEEAFQSPPKIEATASPEKKSNPKPAQPSNPAAYVVGSSPASQQVQKHLSLVAPTDMSTLIIGETGTGKEFVAKAIHQQSQRKDKAFVAIDCGALPKELAGSELFGHVKGAFTGALQDKKGSFELAQGGTLFLDEIGNLTYENQVKLLRVLQERKIKRLGGNKNIPVDVRLIAATNEDLSDLIHKEGFREDLYYRINEFKIELKPLRERKPDISLFAEHFLQLSNQQLNKQVQGFSPEVREKFENYYWHGNLRELKNIIKRSVLLSNTPHIELTTLPPEIIHPDTQSPFQSDPLSSETEILDLKTVAENAEKRAIIRALEKTAYNKTKTAEILDIDRKTLYNKLKAYNIDL